MNNFNTILKRIKLSKNIYLLFFAFYVPNINIIFNNCHYSYSVKYYLYNLHLYNQYNKKVHNMDILCYHIYIYYIFL